MQTNAGDIGLGSRFARREQGGSVMVLAALMMVVLIGLVGLAIDIGHEMEVYRQTQNASDAAALAAVQSLYNQRGFANSTGFTAATNAATLLVQQNGCAGCTLKPLTYYDSSWNPIDPTTGSASSVEYVRADVSSTLPTYFLRVLGFKLSTVGTKAVGAVTSHGECSIAGVCVLSTTQKCALDVTGGAVINMTSTVIVDNSSYQNGGTGSLCVTNNATISDTGTGAAIYNVGASNYCTSSCPSGQSPNVNPTPSPSGHISDPLAYLPPPPLNVTWCGQIDVKSSGNGSSSNCIVSSTSGSQTISPGTYCGITVENNSTLILEPGIYVIFNGHAGCGSGSGLNVAASATIKSINTPLPDGVMLYFTCGSTQGGGNNMTGTAQACTPANKNSAGSLSIAGGATVQLQGIQDTSSPADQYTKYNGMLIFYDRANNSAMTLSGNSSSFFTGTIYGVQSNVSITGNPGVTFGVDSRVISNTLKVDGGNQNNPGGASFTMTANAVDNVQLKTLGGLIR